MHISDPSINPIRNGKGCKVIATSLQPDRHNKIMLYFGTY